MQRSILTCASLLALAGAASAHSQPATAKLRVAVSVLPQAYFVERVGGEFVEVDVLVGPGQSPHAYDATPKQLEGLARAKAYFRTGIDAENTLVPRLEQMFKNLKIIDLRKDVPLRKMTADEAGPCEHEEHATEADHHEHETGRPQTGKAESDHDHQAGRPDPHIWLNPLYAKIQAQTVCDTLVALDPPHAERYRQNLAALQADLDQLHAKLTTILAPLKGRDVFVFHPAFGYFTDAYGLRQVPVEIEGKEPTAKQLAALIDRARTSGVKVIFVQPQFSAKSAEAVARAIDGAVVPMDDLPRDYLKALEEMADKIKAALEKK